MLWGAEPRLQMGLRGVGLDFGGSDIAPMSPVIPPELKPEVSIEPAMVDLAWPLVELIHKKCLLSDNRATLPLV